MKNNLVKSMLHHPLQVDYEAQINALNHLQDYVGTNSITPKLNASLSRKSSEMALKLFNQLTLQDFMEIKTKINEQQLTIKHPVVLSLLDTRLIENTQDYLSKSVVYDSGERYVEPKMMKNPTLGFHLEDNYKLHVIWKSPQLLTSIFQYSTKFRECFLDDYIAGNPIKWNNHKFSQAAFGQEFNTMFIDYMTNWEVYANHPRIGTEKLKEVQLHLLSLETQKQPIFIVQLDNFSLEIPDSLQTTTR